MGNRRNITTVPMTKELEDRVKEEMLHLGFEHKASTIRYILIKYFEIMDKNRVKAEYR